MSPSATLRIYLGAAPGVGKTFAMLNEGWRRPGAGHRRRRRLRRDPRPASTPTEQIGDLEVVPRQGGDLPRHARSRRWTSTPSWPAGRAVALVDELAHTNVPGQPQREALAGHRGAARRRHQRHLHASTSSTSSRSTTSSSEITGIMQRETIPDEVVRAADQIELVDMTPEALRRRMAHGNIYAAEKVDAALANYFRVGNLARPARAGAAVGRRPGRRGAGGVPRAPRHHRRRGRRRERVVVALTGAPGGDQLIRRAARIAPAHARRAARRPRASDTGLSAAVPASCSADHRRLLEELGGEYREVTGGDVAAALDRRSPGPRTPRRSCSAPAGGRGGRS